MNRYTITLQSVANGRERFTAAADTAAVRIVLEVDHVPASWPASCSSSTSTAGPAA